MSAVTELLVPIDGWTVDTMPDVEARCELVDGALVVMPPEAPRNRRVATNLTLLLRPLLPRTWDLLGRAGIYVDLRNYREPDLVVCRRTAVDAGRVTPADVLLAVEVVSPSTRSTDRVAKPVQYATAGIPHFWRIEPEPRQLVVLRLDGADYRETGRFDDVVDLSEPAKLQCRLTDLFD